MCAPFFLLLLRLQVHYALACSSSLGGSGLGLLCGRNDGSLFCLDMKPTEGDTGEAEDGDEAPGKKRGRLAVVPRRISQLLCSLEGGHTRVVRDAICARIGKGVVKRTRMWTGGEDGRICSWSLSQ